MDNDSPITPPLEASPLAAALCRAQTDVKAALKTATNAHHGYNYASAETILIVARDALNAHGLTLSVSASTFEPFPAGTTLGNAVGLLRSTFLLEHKDGATRELTSDTPVCPEQAKTGGWARPLDKALFGAKTEALGYMARDLLMIPRSDAPDVASRSDASDGPAPPARRRAAGAAAAAASAPAAAPALAASPAKPITEEDFKDATVDTIGEILATHRAAGNGPWAEHAFTARVLELLPTTPAPAAWGAIIAAAKLTNGDAAAQLRTAYGAALTRARAAAAQVSA